MILEKNNLQTAQERTKSYIELIASYVHPKTGNHLKSHLVAIMALDYRMDNRLIRRGKKKIRPTFLRSISLLCKIFPKNLGACKTTVYTIYTSHLRWNSSMTHCFYHTGRPRTESSISQYKLHSFNIHKLLKKFPKSPIRPSGSHFCSASCGECLNEHYQSYAPT